MSDEIHERPEQQTGSGPTAVGPDEEPRRGAIEWFLRTRFGHRRTVWRLLAYGVTAAILGVVLAWPLGLVLPDAGGGLTSWPTILAMLAPTVALVAAGLLILRWMDRRPPALLGLGFEPGWLRELGLGLAAGPVLVSLEAVLLGVSGLVGFRVAEDVGASLAALPRLALLFVLAGAVEELLFRGYPLQVLAEGTRRWIAALLLGVLFAAGHLGNPDQTALASTNILLLGLLLAVVYFQTRRLWLPLALHASWNLAQGWLWGFDVSGISLDGTLFVAVPAGPASLTGGGFGLEGSILTTVVIGLVLAWLVWVRPMQPAGQVADRWSRWPRGFGLPPAG